MIADSSTSYDHQLVSARHKPDASAAMTQILVWVLFWPWSILREMTQLLFLDLLGFLSCGVAETFQAITEFEFSDVTSELNGLPPTTTEHADSPRLPKQEVHYYSLGAEQVKEPSQPEASRFSPSIDSYSPWGAMNDETVTA